MSTTRWRLASAAAKTGNSFNFLSKLRWISVAASGKPALTRKSEMSSEMLYTWSKLAVAAWPSAAAWFWIAVKGLACEEAGRAELGWGTGKMSSLRHFLKVSVNWYLLQGAAPGSAGDTPRRRLHSAARRCSAVVPGLARSLKPLKASGLEPGRGGGRGDGKGRWSSSSSSSSDSSLLATGMTVSTPSSS